MIIYFSTTSILIWSLLVFSKLVIKDTDVILRSVMFTQIIALGLGWVAKACWQAGQPSSLTAVSYHSENGSMPWGSQQSCHSCLPWLGVQQLFTPEFVALVLAGFWGLKSKIYFCTLCIFKKSGRISRVAQKGHWSLHLE